jgi:DNA polymerase V
MKFYALLDCNNFYASCERAFVPALAGKPIVVLSNNDGCIIARSKEAKALGIPMGAPLFKWRKYLKANRVEVFSANFSLYGAMSRRVMSLIGNRYPEMEVYSIDEAFIDFNGEPEEILKQALRLRKEIMRATGIPVSIGIARTKTLAKAANHIAKKTDAGAMILADAADVERELAQLEVGDVWGVGYRLKKEFEKVGIKTALNLKNISDKFILKKLSVVTHRTILELRGIDCGEAVHDSTRKSVICSRSFAKPRVKLSELEEAVSYFAERASLKLRAGQVVARAVTVYVATDRFKEDRYVNGKTIILKEYSAYAPDIISASLSALREMFKEGLEYKKAGVVLGDIIAEEYRQTSLFEDAGKKEAKKRLMATVDKLNRTSKNALWFAASGAQPGIPTGRLRKSPDFLTDWSELLTVQA